MIRAVEISFAAPVPRIPCLQQAVETLCWLAGPCTSAMDPGESISSIVVTFQKPVELPAGLDRTLSDLADIACKTYQFANPTRVMWPAGHGFKAQFSQADALFLGEKTAPGAPETGEPTFDEETFAIDCAEREDYYGDNPLNPDRDRLKADCEGRQRVRRATQRQAEEKLQAEAARYRWLRPRMLGADFNWNDSGECALVFRWPRAVPIGTDCDQNIDSAMTADERDCTCHPDDNPPRPCPRKFAYSDCVAASSTQQEQPR